MDNFEYNSPLSELQTSTESVLISEYVTKMIDKVSEPSTAVLDGVYVFYGMGGILIFFVIYMICYSYLIHIKEKEAEQEIELRRLNERASHTPRIPPMNEGRIFIEDFHGVPVNPNNILPRRLAGGCHTIERENIDGALGDDNEESRNIREMNIPYHTPQQIVDRKFFPEEFHDMLCPSATPKQATEISRAAFQKPENRHKMLGCMSTPPLCFSSPRESKEIIFYPENFQDLCPNTTQVEKCGSLKNRQSQEYATTTPSKSNVIQSSPEGSSRSSPTSPDIMRRRLITSEETPRRPSSWR